MLRANSHLSPGLEFRAGKTLISHSAKGPFQITEPVTLLTDYALAAASATGAGFLWRAGRLSRQVSIQLWAAFLAAALATFLGGTFHGFSTHLGEQGTYLLWKATTYCAGLSSLFLLAGAVVASASRPLVGWLLLVATAKFVLYAVWMATHDDFRYVIYDYASSMVAVLLLQLLLQGRTLARGSDRSLWIGRQLPASYPKMRRMLELDSRLQNRTPEAGIEKDGVVYSKHLTPMVH